MKRIENQRTSIFKRIVVVINSLEKIDRLLKKATDFSIQQKIHLEILFIQEEILFDIPNYFLSKEKITNEHLNKKRVKENIQEHLLALGTHNRHSILVYENDTVNQLLYLFKKQKDTLFIIDYHQGLSEKLIKKTPYSFWIIKNDTPKYKTIAFPIDFSKNGHKALKISQYIFIQTPITIIHDYRYLLDTLQVQVEYLNLVPILSPDTIEFNQIFKKKQQKRFEDYKKEFHLQGECIEGRGALDKDLMNYIAKRNFDLTIMYHQDSELFFSPSLILELIKELSTDFFIINL
jgi:hypothetical protein